MAKLTKTEAEQKVFELTEKLIHTQKDFRDLAAGYKDTIKELQNEIKDVVEAYGTVDVPVVPDISPELAE